MPFEFVDLAKDETKEILPALPASLALLHGRQRERSLHALGRQLREMEASPLQWQRIYVQAGDPDFARVARAVQRIGLNPEVHSIQISAGPGEITVLAGSWERSLDVESWFRYWAESE